MKLRGRPESTENRASTRGKAAPAVTLNSAPAAAFLCAQQMSPTDDTHRSECWPVSWPQISVQTENRKTRGCLNTVHVLLSV